LDNKAKNKEARWSRNPYIFDNNYFEELLDKNSPYVKTPSDLALLGESNFKDLIEIFAQDNEKFFEVYAKAHEKLTESGCEGIQLLSEEVDSNKTELI